MDIIDISVCPHPEEYEVIKMNPEDSDTSETCDLEWNDKVKRYIDEGIGDGKDKKIEAICKDYICKKKVFEKNKTSESVTIKKGIKSGRKNGIPYILRRSGILDLMGEKNKEETLTLNGVDEMLLCPECIIVLLAEAYRANRIDVLYGCEGNSSFQNKLGLCAIKARAEKRKICLTKKEMEQCKWDLLNRSLRYD